MNVICNICLKWRMDSAPSMRAMVAARARILRGGERSVRALLSHDRCAIVHLGRQTSAAPHTRISRKRQLPKGFALWKDRSQARGGPASARIATIASARASGVIAAGPAPGRRPAPARSGERRYRGRTGARSSSSTSTLERVWLESALARGRRRVSRALVRFPRLCALDGLFVPGNDAVLAASLFARRGITTLRGA